MFFCGFFFFQAEDGIRDGRVTGVQTCALPIWERLQKIKVLMDGFTAAVEDLAKAQTTLLAQIDKRSVVSDEWTKSVAAQLASPTMAKVDNRLEIERLLFQADAKVSSLRAAAWKLGATGDANLVTEMGKTEASL